MAPSATRAQRGKLRVNRKKKDKKRKNDKKKKTDKSPRKCPTCHKTKAAWRFLSRHAYAGLKLTTRCDECREFDAETDASLADRVAEMQVDDDPEQGGEQDAGVQDDGDDHDENMPDDPHQGEQEENTLDDGQGGEQGAGAGAPAPAPALAPAPVGAEDAGDVRDENMLDGPPEQDEDILDDGQGGDNGTGARDVGDVRDENILDVPHEGEQAEDILEDGQGGEHGAGDRDALQIERQSEEDPLHITMDNCVYAVGAAIGFAATVQYFRP